MKIWAQLDVWLLRKVCVGGWYNSRIESLQVLLTLDFRLWTWTWIVTNTEWSTTSSQIPYLLEDKCLAGQSSFYMIKQNRKHISSYNIHVLLNVSEYDVMNMKERIYCVAAAIKKFGYFAEITFLPCAWYCAWRSSRHNCLISLHTSSHSPVRNKQQISISSTHWTQWSKYLKLHTLSL